MERIVKILTLTLLSTTINSSAATRHISSLFTSDSNFSFLAMQNG